MKQIDVFDGNQLNSICANYECSNPRLAFYCLENGKLTPKIKINDDILSRHILLLGGIGTGKTNTFFQIVTQIKQGMTANDVAIVFDTKGDFLEKFYCPGDVVISNDDTACGPNGIDYWNLFNEIETNDHMEENIAEISKALFHNKIEKTSQPFFPNAAKDLFAAVLTDSIRSSNPLIRNNEGLRNFLDKATGEQIRSLLLSNPDFESMISYISDDRSPQTQGVLSELHQTSREILLGNFKKPGTLSMRNLVRNKGGKFIFIEYDIGVGGMLSPIYSLLFDLAIKEALCRKKTEGNVFFITDEFSLIPNLQHVDDAVNFGRSLGIKFMIGIQNVSQIYDEYGESRGKSLLSGFLTSICFRVNDDASRDFIKGLYGKNRKKEVYTSAIAAKGINEQIRDANVVEDWDILRLGRGEAIVGLPDLEPFIFKFARVT